MAIGRCREETAKGSQRAEAPRGGRDRTMWNTDFNLATVVKKDQELWERELNQVQRIGGFERAAKGPTPVPKRGVLTPLGRLISALA